jgi:hypothetical protein
VRGASCWFQGLRKRALDHFVGLGSADQNASLTSADEQSRNTADADLARQVLIGQDLSRVLPLNKRLAQPLRVNSDGAPDPKENVQVCEILPVLTEGLEQGAVHRVEAAHPTCELSRFERLAAARLDGREAQDHAALLRHRVDRLVPDPMQVLAIRIKGRNRLRAQLEGAPVDLNLLGVLGL